MPGCLVFSCLYVLVLKQSLNLQPTLASKSLCSPSRLGTCDLPASAAPVLKSEVKSVTLMMAVHHMGRTSLNQKGLRAKMELPRVFLQTATEIVLSRHTATLWN